MEAQAGEAPKQKNTEGKAIWISRMGAPQKPKGSSGLFMLYPRYLIGGELTV